MVQTMLLNRFFYYTLGDGTLVGCEHPAVLGRPEEVLKALAEKYEVQAMITLTSRFTDFGVARVRQWHVPMAGLPTGAEIELALALIDTCRQSGAVVCVHCQRGLDRTGCVLGCYLVRQGADPETVIEELLSRFPPGCRGPRFRELWQPSAEIIRGIA